MGWLAQLYVAQRMSSPVAGLQTLNRRSGRFYVRHFDIYVGAVDLHTLVYTYVPSPEVGGFG